MTPSRRFATAVAAGFILVLLAGLGGCGPGGATASGLVTYDGIPVDSGSLKFIAEGDPKQTAVGIIKDGKYEVTADRGLVAGKYKVELTWTKNLPAAAAKNAPPPKKVDPDISTPESKQGADGGAPNPNKTASSTAEIKAGANSIDFPLTSK